MTSPSLFTSQVAYLKWLTFEQNGHVFVMRDGKRPLDYWKSTPSKKRIVKLAQIAIDRGRLPRGFGIFPGASGLCALDNDPKNGPNDLHEMLTKHGFAEPWPTDPADLQPFAARLGLFIGAWKIVLSGSGKPWSLHIYWHAPANYDRDKGAGKTAYHLDNKKAIEFFSGAHFLVLPFSPHKSGKFYELLYLDADSGQKQPPEFILDYVAAAKAEDEKKHTPAPRPASSSPGRYFTPDYEPDKVIRRARAYLATKEPAVAGHGGHAKTFAAACCLVRGFDLTIDQAWPLLQEYNDRCSPPWSDKDLMHKLQDADKSPGPRGELLNAPLPERYKVLEEIRGKVRMGKKAKRAKREARKAAERAGRINQDADECHDYVVTEAKTPKPDDMDLSDIWNADPGTKKEPTEEPKPVSIVPYSEQIFDRRGRGSCPDPDCFYLKGIGVLKGTFRHEMHQCGHMRCKVCGLIKKEYWIESVRDNLEYLDKRAAIQKFPLPHYYFFQIDPSKWKSAYRCILRKSGDFYNFNFGDGDFTIVSTVLPNSVRSSGFFTVVDGPTAATRLATRIQSFRMSEKTPFHSSRKWKLKKIHKQPNRNVFETACKASKSVPPEQVRRVLQSWGYTPKHKTRVRDPWFDTITQWEMPHGNDLDFLRLVRNIEEDNEPIRATITMGSRHKKGSTPAFEIPIKESAEPELALTG